MSRKIETHFKHNGVTLGIEGSFVTMKIGDLNGCYSLVTMNAAGADNLADALRRYAAALRACGVTEGEIEEAQR